MTPKVINIKLKSQSLKTILENFNIAFLELFVDYINENVELGLSTQYFFLWLLLHLPMPADIWLSLSSNYTFSNDDWSIQSLLLQLEFQPEFSDELIYTGNMGNLPVIIIPAICAEKNNPFGDSFSCSKNGMAYVSLSMSVIWKFSSQTF